MLRLAIFRPSGNSFSNFPPVFWFLRPRFHRSKPSDFCPLEAESFKVFSTFYRPSGNVGRQSSSTTYTTFWGGHFLFFWLTGVLWVGWIFVWEMVVGCFFLCWVCLFCEKVFGISKHRRNKMPCVFFLCWGWLGWLKPMLGCERTKIIWVKTNSFLSHQNGEILFGVPRWHPVDICIWMTFMDPVEVVHFQHGHMKPLPKKNH